MLAWSLNLGFAASETQDTTNRVPRNSPFMKSMSRMMDR